MTRLAIVALVTALIAPRTADAFCGFYIAPGGSEMFNNATQVVLMRQGTRTVLSMQNNYQGPPKDFALVIPVPVVLQEADVKTLPKAVFAKVDAMSAPRLVEYWEQDPCYVEPPEESRVYKSMRKKSVARSSAAMDAGEYGVTVEAKFDVGEYQIVILSAKDSTGLDRYLRSQQYKIPQGAEPLLRAYVEGGSKFFVAKVNPAKVRFEHGQAMLSPLRFHYDAEEFSLPIRLGLANSSGTQDLVVNILSDQRYELANYKNVTIPTNFDVKDEVRTRFGEFYAALFDRTVQQNPGAIVTEYAWDAGTCDPCPGPTLDGNDFMTLGADVATRNAAAEAPSQNSRKRMRPRSGLVLTRLHARYGKSGAPNDLVFKTADAIVGGREHRGANGELEHGAEPASVNNFQGRYAIRHPWTGAITCAAPVRGRWGGPPPGANIASPGTAAATNIAFAPRGTIQLPNLVMRDLPEIGVKQGVPLPASSPELAVTPMPSDDPLPTGGGFQAKPQGCGCQATGASSGLVLAGMLLLVLRRRRR